MRDGNTVEQYRQRARRYRFRAGPQRSERAELAAACCWNSFRRSSACEVRRSIVSSEAKGPTAAWTTGVCTAVTELERIEVASMLPSPTAATAIAAAAGARRSL